MHVGLSIVYSVYSACILHTGITWLICPGVCPFSLPPSQPKSSSSFCPAVLSLPWYASDLSLNHKRSVELHWQNTARHHSAGTSQSYLILKTHGKSFETCYTICGIGLGLKFASQAAMMRMRSKSLPLRPTKHRLKGVWSVECCPMGTVQMGYLYTINISILDLMSSVQITCPQNDG